VLQRQLSTRRSNFTYALWDSPNSPAGILQPVRLGRTTVQHRYGRRGALYRGTLHQRRFLPDPRRGSRHLDASSPVKTTARVAARQAPCSAIRSGSANTAAKHRQSTQNPAGWQALSRSSVLRPPASSASTSAARSMSRFPYAPSPSSKVKNSHTAERHHWWLAVIGRLKAWLEPGPGTPAHRSHRAWALRGHAPSQLHSGGREGLSRS